MIAYHHFRAREWSNFLKSANSMEGPKMLFSIYQAVPRNAVARTNDNALPCGRARKYLIYVSSTMRTKTILVISATSTGMLFLRGSLK